RTLPGKAAKAVSNKKYTKAIREAAVRQSVSIAAVLRKLGLAEAGGIHSHISRKNKQFGIDTSHFLGQQTNSGPSHKGPPKLDWQAVLICRQQGPRQKAFRLRRALIEAGRRYRCEAKGCAVTDEWLGKSLMLHINHKNGNWLVDRWNNLEFLCPNCHSQTGNYCGSKSLVELTSVALQCRVYRAKRREKQNQ